MKLIKNLEAAFTVTVVLACSALYLTETPAQARYLPVIAADSTAMQVVMVSAKRLTPAEKLQSLHEEKAQALLAANNRNTI